MLYEFLQIAREAAAPLCDQLYRELRRGIETGRLPAGEKLASIREASAELSLSRTTVEAAYVRLCVEGYVEAKPQSGYRVRTVLPRRTKTIPPAAALPEYDFTTSSIDPEAADLQNWRRLVRAVLADETAVTAYGDPQGELALRSALASYAFHARGVSAEPEDIFIGAGMGPLLQLLCPLFPHRPQVLMESPGFPQAELVFGDYGFPVDVGGKLPQSFPETEDAIAAELPSLRPPAQIAAAAAHREALLAWVIGGRGRYVLEDDYNGELHYRSRPTPAFQGMCPEKTIYLGSFSKLLLPSVRVAYMVLPTFLAETARARLPMLNQTAGKTEQAALAEYIRTGLLEKHLRRLRRLYAKKSQLLAEALEEVFGSACTYTLHETSLAFAVRFSTDSSGEELCRLAREAGAACRPLPGTEGGAPEILLGFSGIAAHKIHEGVEALGRAWRPLL